MTPRQSRRVSRQSTAQPVATLEHDGIAIALQEALGTRVLLIRVIGEGGMGRVYLGRDPQLKRFVAVKVLVQAGGDVEAHARFQREAQAIAAVSHPNVVSIYGVGELPNGTPYFVMEYVSGGSMAERLHATGQLEIEMAEGVLGDVAAALAAAHKRGIVHRDVKPANVLWDEEAERATVSDFGIASLMSESEDENDIRITQGGMTLGSPAYMSPEQLLAEPVTPKSDIYALGLLGYELLTGKGPYTADTPAAVAAAHLRDVPRKLSEIRPEVPPVLEAMMLRCLAKDASERPTADEVMNALAPGGADLLEWPPPGLERARGALWRMMAMPGLGALCLLLPLLVMLWIGHVSLIEDTVIWPIVLGVSVLLGFSALMGTLFQVWRISRIVGTAARLRYGWATLVEVIADRRGDTGALIAGVREYAVLSPRERSTLRFLRVARALLILLAAPASLLIATFALSMRGSNPDGGSAFVTAVTGTVTMLLVVGMLAGVPEILRLNRARRKRGETSRNKSEAELAPAWYAAFDRAREGQALGSGGEVRKWAVAVIGVVIAAMVLSSAAIILTVSLSTLMGQIGSSVFRSDWLFIAAERNGGGRSYRVTPDGVTSPIDAGEALLAIAATQRARPASPIEQRVSTDYPRWRRVVPPSDMFTKVKGEAWTDGAIFAAQHQLTPEQRAVLERAAAHPALNELSRVARASGADVYGALIKPTAGDSLPPEMYPSDVLAGLEEVFESRAARVALDVADHRIPEAERGAREMIAAASNILDMPFSANVFVGYPLLQRGLRTLESVFIASGREREARVMMDSIAAGAAGINRNALSSTNGVTLRNALRNERYARGIRMDMLLVLLSRACADPHQLLFGFDPLTMRDIAYVRDSLTRYPSERLWIKSLERVMNGDLPLTRADRADGGILLGALGMVDGVVGGSRFTNCAVRNPLSLLRD